MTQPGDFREQRGSLDVPIRRGPIVRIGVTADHDLIIVTPVVGDLPLLPPGESPDRWRFLTLVRFSDPISVIADQRNVSSWLLARTTWKVGPVTLQLLDSVKPLIGSHLLKLVGHF